MTAPRRKGPTTPSPVFVWDDVAKDYVAWEGAVTVPGELVTEDYDYKAYTYVSSGNGDGEVSTIVFKSGGSSGTVVATLTFVYDASHRVSSITKS